MIPESRSQTSISERPEAGKIRHGLADSKSETLLHGSKNKVVIDSRPNKPCWQISTVACSRGVRKIIPTSCRPNFTNTAHTATFLQPPAEKPTCSYQNSRRFVSERPENARNFDHTSKARPLELLSTNFKSDASSLLPTRFKGDLFAKQQTFRFDDFNPSSRLEDSPSGKYLEGNWCSGDKAHTICSKTLADRDCYNKASQFTRSEGSEHFKRWSQAYTKNSSSKDYGFRTEGDRSNKAWGEKTYTSDSVLDRHSNINSINVHGNLDSLQKTSHFNCFDFDRRHRYHVTSKYIRNRSDSFSTSDRHRDRSDSFDWRETGRYLYPYLDRNFSHIKSESSYYAHKKRKLRPSSSVSQGVDMSTTVTSRTGLRSLSSPPSSSLDETTVDTGLTGSKVVHNRPSLATTVSNPPTNKAFSSEWLKSSGALDTGSVFDYRWGSRGIYNNKRHFTGSYVKPQTSSARISARLRSVYQEQVTLEEYETSATEVHGKKSVVKYEVFAAEGYTKRNSMVESENRRSIALERYDNIKSKMESEEPARRPCCGDQGSLVDPPVKQGGDEQDTKPVKPGKGGLVETPTMPGRDILVGLPRRRSGSSVVSTAAMPSGGGVMDKPARPSSGGVMDKPARPSSGGVMDKPARPSSGGVMDKPAMPSGGGVMDKPARPSSGGVENTTARPNGVGAVNTIQNTRPGGGDVGEKSTRHSGGIISTQLPKSISPERRKSGSSTTTSVKTTAGDASNSLLGRPQSLCDRKRSNSAENYFLLKTLSAPRGTRHRKVEAVADLPRKHRSCPGKDKQHEPCAEASRPQKKVSHGDVKEKVPTQKVAGLPEQNMPQKFKMIEQSCSFPGVRCLANECEDSRCRRFRIVSKQGSDCSFSSSSCYPPHRVPRLGVGPESGTVYGSERDGCERPPLTVGDECCFKRSRASNSCLEPADSRKFMSEQNFLEDRLSRKLRWCKSDFDQARKQNKGAESCRRSAGAHETEGGFNNERRVREWKEKNRQCFCDVKRADRMREYYRKKIGEQPRGESGSCEERRNNDRRRERFPEKKTQDIERDREEQAAKKREDCGQKERSKEMGTKENRDRLISLKEENELLRKQEELKKLEKENAKTSPKNGSKTSFHNNTRRKQHTDSNQRGASKKLPTEFDSKDSLRRRERLQEEKSKTPIKVEASSKEVASREQSTEPDQETEEWMLLSKSGSTGIPEKKEGLNEDTATADSKDQVVQGVEIQKNQNKRTAENDTSSSSTKLGNAQGANKKPPVPDKKKAEAVPDKKKTEAVPDKKKTESARRKDVQKEQNYPEFMDGLDSSNNVIVKSALKFFELTGMRYFAKTLLNQMQTVKNHNRTLKFYAPQRRGLYVTPKPYPVWIYPNDPLGLYKYILKIRGRRKTSRDVGTPARSYHSPYRGLSYHGLCDGRYYQDYGHCYDNDYDPCYDQRRYRRCDQRYDRRCDQRYDRRCDQRYDRRYDQRYDCSKDQRSKTNRDQRYNRRYDQKSKTHRDQRSKSKHDQRSRTCMYPSQELRSYSEPRQDPNSCRVYLHCLPYMPRCSCGSSRVVWSCIPGDRTPSCCQHRCGKFAGRYLPYRSRVRRMCECRYTRGQDINYFKYWTSSPERPGDICGGNPFERSTPISPQSVLWRGGLYRCRSTSPAASDIGRGRNRTATSPDSSWRDVCRPCLNTRPEDKRYGRYHYRSAPPEMTRDAYHRRRGPDDRTNRSLPPDDRTYKSMPPDDRTYRSLPPDDRTYRSLPPDDRTYRSMPPDDRKYRSMPPDDRTYRSMPPDERKHRSLPPRDTASMLSDMSSVSARSDPYDRHHKRPLSSMGSASIQSDSSLGSDRSEPDRRTRKKPLPPEDTASMRSNVSAGSARSEPEKRTRKSNVSLPGPPDKDNKNRMSKRDYPTRFKSPSPDSGDDKTSVRSHRSNKEKEEEGEDEPRRDTVITIDTIRTSGTSVDHKDFLKKLEGGSGSSIASSSKERRFSKKPSLKSDYSERSPEKPRMKKRSSRRSSGKKQRRRSSSNRSIRSKDSARSGRKTRAPYCKLVSPQSKQRNSGSKGRTRCVVGGGSKVPQADARRASSKSSNRSLGANSNASADASSALKSSVRSPHSGRRPRSISAGSSAGGTTQRSKLQTKSGGSKPEPMKVRFSPTTTVSVDESVHRRSRVRRSSRNSLRQSYDSHQGSADGPPTDRCWEYGPGSTLTRCFPCCKSAKRIRRSIQVKHTGKMQNALMKVFNKTTVELADVDPDCAAIAIREKKSDKNGSDEEGGEIPKICISCGGEIPAIILTEPGEVDDSVFYVKDPTESRGLLQASSSQAKAGQTPSEHTLLKTLSDLGGMTCIYLTCLECGRQVKTPTDALTQGSTVACPAGSETDPKPLLAPSETQVVVSQPPKPKSSRSNQLLRPPSAKSQRSIQSHRTASNESYRPPSRGPQNTYSRNTQRSESRPLSSGPQISQSEQSQGSQLPQRSISRGQYSTFSRESHITVHPQIPRRLRSTYSHETYPSQSHDSLPPMSPGPQRPPSRGPQSAYSRISHRSDGHLPPSGRSRSSPSAMSPRSHKGSMSRLDSRMSPCPSPCLSPSPTRGERSRQRGGQSRPCSPCGDLKQSSPCKDRRQPSPCRDRRQPSPYRDRKSPSPCRDRRSPSPCGDRRQPSPFRDRKSPSPCRERRSPSPCRDRRSPSPCGDRRQHSPSRASSPPCKGKSRDKIQPSPGRTPSPNLRQPSPHRGLSHDFRQPLPCKSQSRDLKPPSPSRSRQTKQSGTKSPRNVSSDVQGDTYSLSRTCSKTCCSKTYSKSSTRTARNTKSTASWCSPSVTSNQVPSYLSCRAKYLTCSRFPATPTTTINSGRFYSQRRIQGVDTPYTDTFSYTPLRGGLYCREAGSYSWLGGAPQYSTTPKTSSRSGQKTKPPLAMVQKPGRYVPLSQPP